jgi:hypothetical protein
MVIKRYSMERAMIKYIYFTLFLFLMGCSSNQKNDNLIPSTLSHAVSSLINTLSVDDLSKITNGSEDELAQLHHGFGTGLRNSWGLWSNSVLAKWFNQKGIYHADDMSGIIITSLYRELNDLPWKLKEQIEYYQVYWEQEKQYEEKEALQKIVRANKRKAAMLGWKWVSNEATEVMLPLQPKFKDVWGLEPYDGGFIVIIKGWRKEFKTVWHDGVYFIDSLSQQLKPISLKNCPEIHDVVVKNETAHWLCKEEGRGWSITSTNPSIESIKRKINNPPNTDWLRLGKSKKGLLVISPEAIYEEHSGQLSAIYKAPSATRKYPYFDHDGSGQENEDEYFFPHRSATPIEYDGAIYFQVENTGNGTDLYRLQLTKENLESADEIFINDYIGRWSINISDIALKDDVLWIGTPTEGTLVKLSKGNEIKIASIFNHLTHVDELDTENPSNWKTFLPTGAITFVEDTMYLASTNGVAKVKNGNITPLVYFTYPDGMNRTPYTSSPQYGFHIKPQRLGVFKDESFIIGDRHDGVYMLMKRKHGYEFYIPSVDKHYYDIQ